MPATVHVSEVLSPKTVPLPGQKLVTYGGFDMEFVDDSMDTDDGLTFLLGQQLHLQDAVSSHMPYCQ